MNRRANNKSWKAFPSVVLHKSTCPMPIVTRFGSRMNPPLTYFSNHRHKIKIPPQHHVQALFNSGDFAPIAFASSLHNEKIAIGNRVLKVTPAVDPAVEFDYSVFFRRNFDQIFSGWRKVTPVPFEYYLANSNASPSVKEVLRKTRLELDKLGIDRNQVSDDLAYKWTTRSSFIKIENQLFNSPATFNFGGLDTDLKENSFVNKPKAPRLIQGATPEYICIMGPFFMAVQQMIKLLWNKDAPLFFTSGANAKTMSKAIFSHNGRKLEDDVGAFDTSVSENQCNNEYWMTKKFGASPLVLQLFRHNIHTHGMTHHGVRYKVKGTRKSGDPFTSVYNSILNGCMHLWAYCRLATRTVKQALGEVKMLVQGDDNVLSHPGPKLDFRWLLGLLGFDCEALYRDNVYDIEFCSNIVYNTIDGYMFGPKPGRVLCKMGYFINPPRNLDPRAVLRGVALGLGDVCTYIPFIDSVCKRILQLTSTAVVTAAVMQYLKINRGAYFKYVKSINIDNEYTLYHRYGLMPSMVRDLVEEMSTKQIGDNYKHVYFDLLFDRDTDASKTIFISV